MKREKQESHMKARAISSSCLFHYTKSFETVISILQYGLRFSEVREPYPTIGWGTSPLTEIGLQRPFIDNRVVCFCDIPLTLAASHRAYYESYAIGLTKEWAINNGVAPVRYVHSNSPGFSGALIELLDVEYNRRELGADFVSELTRHRTGATPVADDLSEDAKKMIRAVENELAKALGFIADGAAFFKTYESDDPLQGTPLKRYYDEREWRAVHHESDALQFKWDDIRYIICSTQDECEKLYERRDEISDSLSLPDNSRLWKKLRSFEEIDSDF